LESTVSEGAGRLNMTEYWFAFNENQPEAVYRIRAEEGERFKGEVFDFTNHEWKTSQTIDRYIFLGEIGYEKTTEEDAFAFILSKRH
jgi:hypothetical protein